MTYYISALGIVLFILVVWLLLKKKGGTETAVSEKTPEERHLEARKRERNEKRAEEEAKRAKEETRRRLEATKKAEAQQKQREEEALNQEARQRAAELARQTEARKRAEGILKAKEAAKKREAATQERAKEHAREVAREEVSVPTLPEYPPFDHSRLIEMGLSDTDASDFVKELIEQIETQIPLIEAVITQQNFEEAEKLTHSIKGSATNIGTGGVSDLIVAYNTYLKTEKDIAQIRCYQEALLQQLEKLKAQYL